MTNYQQHDRECELILSKALSDVFHVEGIDGDTYRALRDLWGTLHERNGKAIMAQIERDNAQENA
jgi:hypothetical protein